MDVQGFKDFLAERELSKKEIAVSICLAERFEGYLESGGGHPATKADVNIIFYPIDPVRRRHPGKLLCPGALRAFS